MQSGLVADDAEPLVGELDIDLDHLRGGSDVVELAVGCRPVPHAGLDGSHAQVVRSEDDAPQGDRAVLGQARILLPGPDGPRGPPAEGSVRLGGEVPHGPQSGLELLDVAALAHARLEGAPGRDGAVHEVGGLVADLVKLVTGPDHGAGGGQPGDDPLEAGAQRVGVGEAQGADGAGLSLEVAAGDLIGRPGEGRGLLGAPVPARERPGRRRDSRPRPGQEDGSADEEPAAARPRGGVRPRVPLPPLARAGGPGSTPGSGPGVGSGSGVSAVEAIPPRHLSPSVVEAAHFWSAESGMTPRSRARPLPGSGSLTS